MEKLWKRIQGWQGKHLTQAGKATLIKAVAQAVPILVMSCFQLPKNLVHDLNMLIARFWWGDSSTRNRIHWKVWSELCFSKFEGGLGFRDFEAFNLALLAKQWWQLINNDNSLLFQVLEARYFPSGNPTKAKVKSGVSYIWRSILQGKKVIEEGSRWRVGMVTSLTCGETIGFRVLNKALPIWLKTINQHHLRCVSFLMIRVNENQELLSSWFDSTVVNRILRIPLSRSSAKDRIIWMESPIGIFLVRSAYYKGKRDARTWGKSLV